MNIDKNLSNQRRKPKQARARQKYDAVLDACTQVLASHGYHKATILELSLVSEVAVPTIYQYFPNKEAIFIAWYERTIEQVLDQLLQLARAQQSMDMPSFIHLMIRGGLMTMDGNRASLRKLMADLPEIVLSHAVATSEQQTAKTVMSLVSEYLTAQPSPELEARLRIMVAALVGYMIQRVLRDDEPDDLNFVARELSALVMAYLGQYAAR